MPERGCCRASCSCMAAAGWREAWKPMTDCAGVSANETGCRVIAVDYRLAPDPSLSLWPVADAIAALTHVTKNRQGVRHRSGCGWAWRATAPAAPWRLCCAASRAMPPRKETMRPPVAFQLLLCPILDVHGESAARRLNWPKAISWTAKLCKRDLELYVPEGAELLNDMRLSPLCAPRSSRACRQPSSIPAQFDPFSDEGEEYAQKPGAALACRCMAAPIPA